MKLVIFEGPDNLGKSTLIHKLVDFHKDNMDITLMHFTGPKGNPSCPFLHQIYSFNVIMSKIHDMAEKEHRGHFEHSAYVPTDDCEKWDLGDIDVVRENLVILDRSWFGEFVYGQMYRNAKEHDIFVELENLYENHIASAMNIEVYVVHLDARPEFILEHDDNKSITSTLDHDLRLSKITKEREMFFKCFSEFEHLGYKYVPIRVEDEKNETYYNADALANIIDKAVFNEKE